MTTKTATRRYYHHPRRGFANEYAVAIATTERARQHYESTEGWERVPRKDAEKLARYTGDPVTEPFVRLELDAEQVPMSTFGFELGWYR